MISDPIKDGDLGVHDGVKVAGLGVQPCLSTAHAPLLTQAFSSLPSPTWLAIGSCPGLQAAQFETLSKALSTYGLNDSIVDSSQISLLDPERN